MSGGKRRATGCRAACSCPAQRRIELGLLSIVACYCSLQPFGDAAYCQLLQSSGHGHSGTTMLSSKWFDTIGVGY